MPHGVVLYISRQLHFNMAKFLLFGYGTKGKERKRKGLLHSFFHHDDFLFTCNLYIECNLSITNKVASDPNPFCFEFSIFCILVSTAVFKK